MSDIKQIDPSTQDETNIENDQQVMDTYEDKPSVTDFKEGNINIINDYFNLTYRKVTTIKNAVLPVIEATLIQLLGNSGEYSRQSCQVIIEHKDSSPIFNLDIIYYVPKWIGVDIKKESITSDVTFIYDKISKFDNVEYKHCSIDCATGTLRIEFQV